MCGREGSHLSTDVERESGRQVEQIEIMTGKAKERGDTALEGRFPTIPSYLSRTLNSDGHESRWLELEI